MTSYRCLVIIASLHVWLGLAHLWPVSVASAQSISPEQLAKVRKACVFIHNRDGEGSGFVIQRSNHTAIIATAAHVICNDRGEPAADLRVVLQSGTDDEATYKARVLGSDVSRDVAFLEVRAQGLPEPIYLAPDATVAETMDVIIAGYPYGGDLAVSRMNPELSISKGAVSSVRSGLTASAAVIQLDINLNPGNSGGPVLNTSGEVIGLVQAKVDGTSLGFAMPARQIVSDLMGDVYSIASSDTSDDKQLLVVGKLIDPLGRIVSGKLLAGSVASIGSLDLRANKSWPQIPNKYSGFLSRSGDYVFANLKLPLDGIPAEETAVQFACQRIDGTVVNSPPVSVRALLKAARARQKALEESPESQPPSSSATPRTTPEVELTVKLRQRQPTALLSDTTLVRSGILSGSLPLGDYQVRRVMIPRTRYAPKLWWNASGDKLIVPGEQTCMIEFPQAREVKLYDLLDPRAWSHLRGNQLLHQIDGKTIQAIDLPDGTVSSEWQFSESVKLSSLASSSNWLISSLDGSRVYLLDEQVARLKKVELPYSGASQGSGDIYVAPGEGLLFERASDQLRRYKLSRGKIVTEESAVLDHAPFEYPTLLPASDAQILLLLSNSKSLADRRSRLLAYVSQDFTRKFSVEVPDYVRCAVRDPKRNRVIMGGLESIWFWYPREGKLQSLPFLKSAPAIDTISLHPEGHTLAVLCGSGGTSASLYWLSLDPTDATNRD